MSSNDSSIQTPSEAVWSVYKVPLLLGITSIIFVGLSIALLVKSAQNAAPIQFSSESALGVGSEASAAGNTGGIMVDVAGAVVAPGVYRLAPGARVEEALAAAGGLTNEADADWVAKNVNRAMKVSDGVKIYIPKAGEPQTSQSSLPSGLWRISVNSASQSELESLSGVGPVTAQKIITNRPYTSLDELVAKKAIGQSLYDKLKSQLSL